MIQLSYLSILTSVALTAAWPAVMYSDMNCTHAVASYSHIPVGACIPTKDVQSYRGSLESDKQELLLYRNEEDCADKEAYPVGVIEGSPQKCVFIYKHLGPFGSAKLMPVQFPENHELKMKHQD